MLPTIDHGYISHFFLNTFNVNIHYHNQTLNLQPWLHLLFSRSFHVQYSYSQPDSQPTPATSPIFIIVNIFNINIHNQTHYQPWLHLLFSRSFYVQYSYSQPDSLPTLATSPIFIIVNIFNINIHNQTRYQPWLHLLFSRSLHVQYQYS